MTVSQSVAVPCVFSSHRVQTTSRAAQVSDTEAKLAAEAAGGERARGEAAALQKELTGMKAALDGTAADLTAERASSEAGAVPACRLHVRVIVRQAAPGYAYYAGH